MSPAEFMAIAKAEYLKSEIPAADFDFSTIKAGNEVVLRLRVDAHGVDADGYIATILPGFGRYYLLPSVIHSVIPGPDPASKPKTLRERALGAAVEAHSTDIVDIVDAVLALFPAEEGQ